MRLALLAAALCVCGVAAHADTINTYTINAPLSGGGLFSGTFAYNATNPLSSTLMGAATGSSVNGTVSGPAAGQSFGPGFTDLFFFENTGNGVNLVYAGSAFSGVLCTTASTNCGGQPSVIGTMANFLGTTTIVPFVAAPVSVTPEPSSFVLLGTGLLGLVGAARKRFA